MIINTNLQLNTTKSKSCKDEIKNNLQGKRLLTKDLKH